MKKIKDILVEENVSLKKYNTFRIEAKTKYLAHVSSLEGLLELLDYVKENNIPYFILGNGSNIVLDDYFDGVIIKLTNLNNVEIKGDVVVAEAGAMLGKIVQKSIDNSLTGLEWAMNIPGTVGGAIVGNAGAYQSAIFDNLINVKVITPDGKVQDMKKEAFHYGYRNSNVKEMGLIVLAGTFKLQEGDPQESKELISDRTQRRIATQPIDMPSAGSVFRNPEGDFAGRLIEAAGLKGKIIGGAQVSLKHANFIVNTGTATSNDIKNLIKLIKEEVKNQFGVDLILEQEIIEWK